jgi:hypothetical protein
MALRKDFNEDLLRHAILKHKVESSSILNFIAG